MLGERLCSLLHSTKFINIVVMEKESRKGCHNGKELKRARNVAKDEDMKLAIYHAV